MSTWSPFMKDSVKEDTILERKFLEGDFSAVHISTYFLELLFYLFILAEKIHAALFPDTPLRVRTVFAARTDL